MPNPRHKPTQKTPDSTRDNTERISWDVDEDVFKPTDLLTIPAELELESGVWAWVRAKADYEGSSHNEALARLITEAKNWALYEEILP